MIIDLGYGHAGKLVGLHSQHPQLEPIGVDFGPKIDWCRRNLSIGRWFEADLVTATTLPLPLKVTARSVVACSDVLEHLIDPRPAMRLICKLLKRPKGRA